MQTGCSLVKWTFVKFVTGYFVIDGQSQNIVIHITLLTFDWHSEHDQKRINSMILSKSHGFKNSIYLTIC